MTCSEWSDVEPKGESCLFETVSFAESGHSGQRWAAIRTNDGDHAERRKIAIDYCSDHWCISSYQDSRWAAGGPRSWWWWSVDPTDYATGLDPLSSISWVTMYVQGDMQQCIVSHV